jgi:hypothetical protein
MLDPTEQGDWDVHDLIEDRLRLPDRPQHQDQIIAAQMLASQGSRSVVQSLVIVIDAGFVPAPVSVFSEMR